MILLAHGSEFTLNGLPQIVTRYGMRLGIVIDAVEPWLTLEGLRLIWQMNEDGELGGG